MCHCTSRGGRAQGAPDWAAPGQISPKSGNVGGFRAKFGRSWPMPGQIWSASGRCRAKLGRIWPTPGQKAPADSGPKLEEAAPDSGPTLVESRPMLDDSWPNLVSCGANSVDSGPNLARIWPNSGQIWVDGLTRRCPGDGFHPYIGRRGSSRGGPLATRLLTTLSALGGSGSTHPRPVTHLSLRSLLGPLTSPAPPPAPGEPGPARPAR